MAAPAASGALFYQDRSVRETAQGLNLITFEKGKLALTEEGEKLLMSIDRDTATNLLFIFGNARSGKSFLMNCLVGVPGLFKVMNSSEPCTRGVDISSYICKQSMLARKIGAESGEAKLDDKRNPLIGFVDVEGQGAEDGTYDTMLALPLLVTSKVVLFNHKGAPTVSDMLSKLGVLARAADYIDLSDPDEKKAEGEAEVEEKKEVKKGPKFGHLHVCFRDFSFDGDEHSVYEQLMGMEKISKSLKATALDAAKASKERNDIRQLLKDNFQTIHVWLFKQPANADDLRHHKELPASMVDHEFTTTVNHLLKMVCSQMKEPTLFNGKPLTGPRLTAIIGQVTSALNEGGIINVPSVYRAMEKETVARIAVECLRIFNDDMKAIKAAMPLGTPEFKTKVATANEFINTKFESELKECPLEDEKKLRKDDMNAQVALIIESARKENDAKLLLKIRDVVTTGHARVRELFSTWCKTNMPCTEGKIMEAQFDTLLAEGNRAIHAGLAGLPEAIVRPEYQLMLLDGEQSLREYLTRMTLENNSMLKDATIEKLRDEAMKRQKLLIEQNQKLEQYLKEEKVNTDEMHAQLEQLRKRQAEDDAKTKSQKEQLDKQAAELETLKVKQAAIKNKKCVIL